MKYFSLGREVTIVDDAATCIVDVALGAESMAALNIKSYQKAEFEALTYWAEIVHTMPVRVTLSDAEGNVIDAFEINTTNVIRYGNSPFQPLSPPKAVSATPRALCALTIPKASETV